MDIVNIEPITAGWSNDKKYCVTDENGTRFLLRISDIADHDAKQAVSRLRALERSRAIYGNRFSPGQCFRIAFIEKMDEIG